MDQYSYTNACGHEPNCDYCQFLEHEDQVFMVLCDGLNGLPSGDEAAKIIADAAMGAFLEGEAPVDVCKTANSKFRDMQFDNVTLRRAGATICAVKIKDGVCSWANVGDSHIYHFSDGKLAHHSVDDTPTYKAMERGEMDYEAIREQEDRTGMSVCIGQKETVEPHTEEFPFNNGDGLILCSDGFWENVYETEMLLDFHKSYNSKDWAKKMLLRAALRNHLNGDNLTLITYKRQDG